MLKRLLAVLTLSISITACGGGGSGGDSSPATPPDTKPPESTEDNTPPTITLLGDADVRVEFGFAYEELGALANDDVDGPLEVSISGVVDVNVLGRYEVTYTAQDKSGNSSTAIRTVEVIDSIPPTVALTGDSIVIVELGGVYNELGATALDNTGSDLAVVISGSVDTNTVGNYQITYYAEDEAGNGVTSTRTVQVVDRTAPVIVLVGGSVIQHALGSDFVDPGVSATDNYDSSVEVTIGGSVDTSVLGTYTLSYTGVDSSGNETTVTRDVVVSDLTGPVITLVGANPLTIFEGDVYTDQGATALDNVDGDVSGDLQSSIVVDSSTPGTYTAKYYVYDAAGNYSEISRDVIVEEKSYDITFRDADLALYENEYKHRFWFDFAEEQNTSRQLIFRVSDDSTAEKDFDFALVNTLNNPDEQSGFIELSIFDDSELEGQEEIMIDVLNDDFEILRQVVITLDDATTLPVLHAPLVAGFRYPSTGVIDDMLYLTDGRRVLRYDLAKEQNVGYSPNQDAPFVSFGDGVVYDGEMYFFAEGVLFRVNQDQLSLEAVSSSPSFVKWISELQVVGNKLYVIGGWSESDVAVDTNYSYNFDTGNWATEKASFTPRYGSATAVVGGSIYVFGGNYSGYEYSSYNPSSDSWLVHGSHTALGHNENTAVSSGKYVYVSESNRNSNQLIMRYDTVNMSWDASGFGVASSSNLDSFIYKGRIYLIAGDNGVGFEGSSQVASVYWGDD
ncbi:immunoglobulin-like domain-containing protein [Vibrio owensii]|uniref:immunoglobulin-like domain-containing protein n=1 Tax=Vibrio owensii TaxID=696485 RepID=UPI0018F1D5CF|nr:immunoglobulin-like domain-containing protein [Vibrio owensii]